MRRVLAAALLAFSALAAHADDAQRPGSAPATTEVKKPKADPSKAKPNAKESKKREPPKPCEPVKPCPID